MKEFIGKTIAEIYTYGDYSAEVDIQFTDGSMLYLWSRGDWGSESTITADTKPYEYSRVERESDDPA